MRHRGTPFVGVLYVGLALTARGPRVIEFNVRFGDPETQVVLARLLTPVGGLLHAAATGGLAEFPALRWSEEHAVTVVVAAEGYPAQPRTGGVVEGVDEVPGEPDAYVLHAGTARADDGVLVSAGDGCSPWWGSAARWRRRGRGPTPRSSAVRLAGAHHRGDIALAAERGEVTVPA